ncbi:MAG: hypothetical protein ACYS72_02830 [Planctomycetota bacterium]|jgi:hypothetical protein
MTTEPTDNHTEPVEAPEQTPDESGRQTVQPDNAIGDYLFQILSGYCRLAHIKQAAILRANPDSSVHILSVCPRSVQVDPQQPWLGRSAQLYPQVIAERKSILQPLQGADELHAQPVQQYLLLIPFAISEMDALVAVFRVETKDPHLRSLHRRRWHVVIRLLHSGTVSGSAWDFCKGGMFNSRR